MKVRIYQDWVYFTATHFIIS